MKLNMIKIISEQLSDCLMLNKTYTKRNIAEIKQRPQILKDHYHYPIDALAKRNIAYWNLLNRKYKIVK